MNNFTPLIDGKPDAIDVELMLIGAIENASDATAIQRAVDGEYAALNAELLSEKAAWTKQGNLAFMSGAKPLPEPAYTADSANKSFSTRGFALAAALLFAITVGVLFQSPVEPVVRAMGALPVDTWTQREGQAIATPIQYLAQDQLFLRFVAPRDGFVTVAHLSEHGDVRILWQSDATHPTESGHTFSLDGAVQLDSALGKEWLVVLLSDKWQYEKNAASLVKEMLPNPTTRAKTVGGWAHEITRVE